ncbi:hypothetical protein BKA57DRAFT_447488 [Linnemannia elongata]|nr:hypothetical protein BKA57DRAFT_447488 [Linnemannia elongata]
MPFFFFWLFRLFLFYFLSFSFPFLPLFLLTFFLRPCFLHPPLCVSSSSSPSSLHSSFSPSYYCISHCLVILASRS